LFVEVLKNVWFCVLALSVKKNGEKEGKERRKKKKEREEKEKKLILALSGWEYIQGGCFPD